MWVDVTFGRYLHRNLRNELTRSRVVFGRLFFRSPALACWKSLRKTFSSIYGAFLPREAKGKGRQDSERTWKLPLWSAWSFYWQIFWRDVWLFPARYSLRKHPRNRNPKSCSLSRFRALISEINPFHLSLKINLMFSHSNPAFGLCLSPFFAAKKLTKTETGRPPFPLTNVYGRLDLLGIP